MRSLNLAMRGAVSGHGTEARDNASLLPIGFKFVFGDQGPPTARLTGDVKVTAKDYCCLGVSGHHVAEAYIKEA